MEINNYFFGIAKIAEAKAHEKGLKNIKAEWLYAQFYHETGGFTSQLQASNKNLGGVTQSQPNSSPQPDGTCYYIEFNTFEDYGDYFGRYLNYYRDSNIQDATNLKEYITALKNSPSGAYFGDSFENYYYGCQLVFKETFGCEG